jgi:hypothetical protein
MRIKYYFYKHGVWSKVVSEKDKLRILNSSRNCCDSDFTYIGKFKDKGDCYMYLSYMQS